MNDYEFSTRIQIISITFISVDFMAGMLLQSNQNQNSLPQNFFSLHPHKTQTLNVRTVMHILRCKNGKELEALALDHDVSLF